MWGEPRIITIMFLRIRISTHSPRVGRTDQIYEYRSQTNISTHSPRVGRTLILQNYLAIRCAFQLTRPVWGEPFRRMWGVLPFYISTHSPRVGRTPLRADPLDPLRISTHSPRVGRTNLLVLNVVLCSDFNSLAPCGANHNKLDEKHNDSEFQLTRPVWGEPIIIVIGAVIYGISTHSPRVGRTLTARCATNRKRAFQLTRPVWGEPR